jgi:hypothetical protein
MNEDHCESDNFHTDKSRVVHTPSFGMDRMYERPVPMRRSDSGLASRDYRPRMGGPELVTSWPLGTAPGQTTPGDDEWVLTASEFTMLQRTLFQLPYLGPIDYNKMYLNVRGRGRVECSGATMTLRISNENLSGKPYETEIDLTNTENEPFISPMVELTPDGDEYGTHTFIGAEMYGGYTFEGKITDGSAYLDQGTAVQLWSE